jgi:hypothetical protein
MGNKGQVGYPSDVSDEEWSFVAPYLALCREDAGQTSDETDSGILIWPVWRFKLAHPWASSSQLASNREK